MKNLIETVNLKHGFDFSKYSETSLQRRVDRIMALFNIASIEELNSKINKEDEFFQPFLNELTVNVTEMFRDEVFFNYLRNELLPKLSSYPSIRTWHAGCSTGEEVFSVCILLKELGMLDKTTIYASDINKEALKYAEQGIIPLSGIKEYTRNYRYAGGEEDFSSYYNVNYNKAVFNEDIRKNIVFVEHNLTKDQSFNNFHLIICRNVLIYFKNELQNEVFGLFNNSLNHLGYLALGLREGILHCENANLYNTINSEAKVYRKK
jgi:chemotaxis protein methyltransferase CheR